MTDVTFVVRNAERADLDAVLTLLNDMGTLEAKSDDAHRLGEIWREMLDQPSRFILMAFAGSTAVGTLDLQIVPNLTHGGRPWAVVENLVVAESVRRRGVGRALMDAAMARCRDAGCYKVQLVSNERRTEAHRLYEACGLDAPVRGFRRYFRADDD